VVRVEADSEFFVKVGRISGNITCLFEPYADIHLQRVLATTDGDAFDWGDIAEVATPGDGEVPGAGNEVVGGVKIDPAEIGNKDSDPGVGGLGALEVGVATEIATDITGGEAVSAESADHDVGKVLTDAFADLQDLFEWGFDGGGFGGVVEIGVDFLHEGRGDFDERAIGGEDGPGVVGECFEVRNERGFPDKFACFDFIGGVAVAEPLAGVFPGGGELERIWKGNQFDEAGGGDGEAIMGLEHGKGADVIAEVVFAGNDGGGLGDDGEIPVEEFLPGEDAWGQASLTLAMRHRALVGVAGGMGDAVDHGAYMELRREGMTWLR
jgi:hypothetical protein